MLRILVVVLVDYKVVIWDCSKEEVSLKPVILCLFSSSCIIRNYLPFLPTGRGVMDCSVIIQPLGSDTWLSLTNQINKSANKSVRILVTMATSRGSKTNKKIVSFDLTKGGYPDHLEDGYQFQPENLSLGILANRRENEGWYFVSLEENVSVQQFCMQLKLYGKNGSFHTSFTQEA